MTCKHDADRQIVGPRRVGLVALRSAKKIQSLKIMIRHRGSLSTATHLKMLRTPIPAAGDDLLHQSLRRDRAKDCYSDDAKITKNDRCLCTPIAAKAAAHALLQLRNRNPREHR